jgi:NAD(P)H dehydrogenase (quinone)
MDDNIKVAVIYYSSTGNIHRLAQTAAKTAEEMGAETRFRRIQELAPQQALDSNPAWAAHAEETADIPVADVSDLDWADVAIFGSPTRYGHVTSQFQQFLDLCGPLWEQGKLADKIYTGFTSSQTPHGGQESTLLSLYTTIYHWGGIVVAPGYTDPIQFQLGNPYGVSHTATPGNLPGDTELEGARIQTRRAIGIAAALNRGRAGSGDTAQ